MFRKYFIIYYTYILHVSIDIIDCGKCSIQLVTLSNRTFTFIVEGNHIYRVLMYLDHHLMCRWCKRILS